MSRKIESIASNLNISVKLDEGSDLSWPRFLIMLDGSKIGQATVIIKDAGAFLEIIMLDKDHQGKNYATAIYDAIEKKIKQPLLPSPLGLSAQAERFWKRRLSALPAKEKQRRMDAARSIGLSYGLSEKRIDDRFAPIAKMVIARGEQNNVVYHFTSHNNALQILQTGNIELTSDAGTDHERSKRVGKNMFYLSTTRSTLGEFSRKNMRGGSMGAVHLVMDRNAIAQRYSIKPTDYWDSQWIQRQEYDPTGINSREMEDRIYAKHSTIPIKGIVKEIHVCAIPDPKSNPRDPANKSAEYDQVKWTNVRKLLLAAKVSKIPVRLWTNVKDFLNQNFAKQAKLSDLKGFVDSPAPAPRGRYSRFSREEMDSYIELFYKKSRDELSKEALRRFRTLLYYPHDFKNSMKADLHNTRTSNREQAKKLYNVFRAAKVHSVDEFYDKMEVKWRAINKVYEEEYYRKWDEKEKKRKQEEEQEQKQSMAANLLSIGVPQMGVLAILSSNE